MERDIGEYAGLVAVGIAAGFLGVCVVIVVYALSVYAGYSLLDYIGGL